MRSSSPAIYVIAVALGLGAQVFVPPPAAHADGVLYKCTDRDGRVWITNEKKKGMRCHAGMKLPGGDGAVSGSKKGRSGTGFRPPGAPSSSSSSKGGAEGRSLKERVALYRAYIEEAADRYRIPAAFIMAVIRVESGFHFRAVSSVGAQGLMQLMPKTGRAMGVTDAFDPQQNILGGTRLLRSLANRYQGDMVKVLSAYHAGSGAVASKGGIPYEGTEGYVRAVLDHYYRYKVLGP